MKVKALVCSVLALFLSGCASAQQIAPSQTKLAQLSQDGTTVSLTALPGKAPCPGYAEIQRLPDDTLNAQGFFAEIHDDGFCAVLWRSNGMGQGYFLANVGEITVNVQDGKKHFQLEKWEYRQISDSEGPIEISPGEKGSTTIFAVLGSEENVIKAVCANAKDVPFCKAAKSK